MNTVAVSGSREEAAAVWRELVPLMSARPRGRRWRPGHRYDRSTLLRAELPEHPTAVHLFDRAGRTIVLALDFDPSRNADPDAVARDAELAATWIRRAGGRVVRDRSTRGGEHILVPLDAACPLSVRHLRPVLDELAHRLPTLDITPMTNLGYGCITPPGSPCKEGGYRRLITPLPEAVAAFAERSSPATIAALAALLNLGASPLEPATVASGVVRCAFDDEVAVGGPVLELPPAALEFAVHGVLPDRRNCHGQSWTRHEARQSMLSHAALRGMNYTMIHDRIASGVWPGARAAYDRYGRSWESRLRADWAKALTWARSVSPKFRVSDHKQVHTGGAPELREWLARSLTWVAECAELEGQTRWTARAILEAIAYAGQIAGTRVGTHVTVAMGRRWYSIAAGLLHQETVSEMLRKLRDLPGSPLLLIERAEGTRADRYALVIARNGEEEVPLDRALVKEIEIGPVHKAWAVLGLAARTVYEAIESSQRTGRPTIRPQDLPEATGMSRAQVYAALVKLAAHGLVERGHGWVEVGRRPLGDVAEAEQVKDVVARRHALHLAERSLWNGLLSLWAGECAVDDRDVERLPVDPWTLAEQEEYLAAVVARGAPPVPDHELADVGAVCEVEIEALMLLFEVLGASYVDENDVISKGAMSH